MSLPAIGPRPKPEEASPLTMNRPSSCGMLPMTGLPSSENGIRPAQVRAMECPPRKGRTSETWPKFTSMPVASMVAS